MSENLIVDPDFDLGGRGYNGFPDLVTDKLSYLPWKESFSPNNAASLQAYKAPISISIDFQGGKIYDFSFFSKVVPGLHGSKSSYPYKVTIESNALIYKSKIFFKDQYTDWEKSSFSFEATATGRYEISLKGASRFQFVDKIFIDHLSLAETGFSASADYDISMSDQATALGDLDVEAPKDVDVRINSISTKKDWNNAQPDHMSAQSHLGTIQIKASGEYTYTPKDGAVAVDDIATDHFVYEGIGEDGKKYLGNLDVTVTGSAEGTAEANLMLLTGAGVRAAGLAGDDTYLVDQAGDQVVEARNGGSDTVIAQASYALAAGQEIETLQLQLATGSKALDLTGNEFANTLRGNNGANVLDGGGSADMLYGKRGDDSYLVDTAGDRVFETAGQGHDRILSSTSYALRAGQEIETLQLLRATGHKALDLTGNEVSQTLVGYRGSNVLDGGLGNDVLTGRSGGDTFVFSTKLGKGNVDHVTDFSARDDGFRLDDTIFRGLKTGMLSADAFKDVGTARIDADDRILYDAKTGALSYDADGSGKGATTRFAVLDNHARLDHTDFFIV